MLTPRSRREYVAVTEVFLVSQTHECVYILYHKASTVHEGTVHKASTVHKGSTVPMSSFRGKTRAKRSCQS